jgi:cbb3-type cytochrome oxidase subunit 3
MRIVLLLLFLALLFAAYRLLRRSRFGLDAVLDDYARRRATEDVTPESAPWFGRTGLP